MPCTNFMGIVNSEGLLACHHNIINTSKETGNLVGSEENSEGLWDYDLLHGRKTSVDLDSKIGGRELWRGKREAKVRTEIAQELIWGHKIACGFSLAEYIIYLKTK